MTQIVIPERTKNSGKWTVKVSKRLKRHWGYCLHHENVIVISQDCERHGVDRQTFLHELTHKICPWMAEDAVDHLATILDDGVESKELPSVQYRKRVETLIRKQCPWMSTAAIRDMASEMYDALEVMDLL